MRIRRILTAAVLLLAVGHVSGQDALDRSQQTSRQTTRDAQASQRRIDALSERTRELLEQYRSQLWKAQQLQLYVRQLETTIAEQERQKADLQEQLERLARTREALVPMLVRMVDGLEQFIGLDMPFLLAERSERIERLRKVLADPDMAVSEQYRRVFEAYQVEVNYGRSLEAWRAPLPDSARMVDYLRVGRMAWYYLSLDGKGAWQWNARRESWDEVGSQHLTALRQGLRVASEQAAPALLPLPVAEDDA